MGQIANAFLVGGARCATSTTAYTLAEHPNVYLPPVKEPSFFGNEWGIGVPSYRDYERLYDNSKEKVRLDCSTTYLHSKSAVEEIYKKVGDAKIIIHLRDPIERAKSQYRLQRRNGNEKLCFERAIKKEEERKEKGMAPVFHYTTKSFYNKQVKKYQNQFSNVRVSIFEEFLSDPMKSIKRHAEFLSVKPKLLPNKVNKSNSGNEPLFEFVNKLLVKEFPLRKEIASLIPWWFRRWIVAKVRMANLSSSKKEVHLESDLKNKTVKKFKQDVKRLNHRVNTDLKKVWPRYFS